MKSMILLLLVFTMLGNVVQAFSYDLKQQFLQDTSAQVRLNKIPELPYDYRFEKFTITKDKPFDNLIINLDSYADKFDKIIYNNYKQATVIKVSANEVLLE